MSEIAQLILLRESVDKQTKILEKILETLTRKQPDTKPSPFHKDDIGGQAVAQQMGYHDFKQVKCPNCGNVFSYLDTDVFKYQISNPDNLMVTCRFCKTPMIV